MMTLSNCILASASSGPFLDLSPGNREAFFVFAALLLVITLVLCWILFFRNPSRRRRHKHSQKEARPNANANEFTKSGTDAAPTKRRRRVRRSNHPQRPINPTLAQTKGLPPLKTMRQDSNSSY